MTLYSVVPATVEHALELEPKMRQADRAECEGMGWEALPGLLFSLKHSRDSWAGLADGECVCIFGVYCKSFLGTEANPWLLATDEMPKHARTFLRLNKRYMASLRDEFQVLSGHVDVNNVVSQRWLRWLGFSVSETVSLRGMNGVAFLKFEIRS